MAAHNNSSDRQSRKSKPLMPASSSPRLASSALPSTYNTCTDFTPHCDNTHTSSTTTNTTRRRLPLTPTEQQQQSQGRPQQQRQQQRFERKKPATPPTPAPRRRARSAHCGNSVRSAGFSSPLSTSSSPATTTQEQGSLQSGKPVPAPRYRSKQTSGYSTNVSINAVRLKLDRTGNLLVPSGAVADRENFFDVQSEDRNNFGDPEINSNCDSGNISGFNTRNIRSTALVRTNVNLDKAVNNKNYGINSRDSISRSNNFSNSTRKDNSSITDRPFPRKESSHPIVDKITEDNFGLYDEDFRRASSSAIHAQLQTSRSCDRLSCKRDNSPSLTRNGYRLNNAKSDHISRNSSRKIRFYITDDDEEEGECNQEDEYGDQELREGLNKDESSDSCYQGNEANHFGASSSSHSKHSNSSYESRHEGERPKPLSNQGQINLADSALRRMSAPELPPIADSLAIMGKGRTEKRKTSTNSVASSGSKNSMNQLAAAVNSKTFYNRKAIPSVASNYSTPDNGRKISNNNNNNNSNSSKNNFSNNNSNIQSKNSKKTKTPIPRNHSDSSLKGLMSTNNSSLSQISANPERDGLFGNTSSPAAGASGSNAASRPPKFLSKGSRALSWCATENSGSQSKLETLFEGQNIVGSNNNLVTSNKTNSSLSINMPHCNSSGNLLNGALYGNEDLAMPSIALPDRCVSVNGIRTREEIMRLQASNRKLYGEDNDAEISILDDCITKSHVMRRSQSENKLGTGFFNNSTTSLNSGGGGGGGNSFNNSYNSNNNNNNNSYFNNNSNTISNNNNNNNNSVSNNGKNNSETTKTKNTTTKAKQKQNHRTMSRNLSVDRIDKLTIKPARRTSTTSKASVTQSRMRRVNSLAALNNTKTNKGKAVPTENTVDDGIDDELCMEASARLVEWLNEVNNVDEYDTDPKDTVIEYVDEPPQTDTALHVVYDEGK